MERPDGYLLEIETIRSRDSTTEVPLTTSRMVDLSIGLDLDKEDEKLVHRAFSKMPDNLQSLNQSLSYIKETPLLVDIELKRTNSDRDPRVQLAVWKAGGFKKLQYHRWDTSIPMPGITVNGSEWDCFLFFMRDSELVGAIFPHEHSFPFPLRHAYAESDIAFQIMMGPVSMGSTRNVNGTFEIAYKLYVLMKWGKTDYETWFKKHLLTWCKYTAAGTMPVEAGLTSLQL